MLKKSLPIIIFTLLTLSCKKTTSPVYGDRTFVANKVLGGQLSNNLTTIEANHVGIGENVSIYIDIKSIFAKASKDFWNDIIAEFDKNYSKIIEVYGTHTDVDKNGKVILLFYPLPNGLGGYFTGADLFKEFGRNNAEIVYINDMYFYGFDITEIMDTIIHEFQHLINFNMNYMKKGTMSSTWINESLSESTYFVVNNGEPNDSRFTYYTNLNYSPVYNIVNGNYFYTWNGVESYITGSMFMYWLYLHGGGETILKDIVANEYSYDYRGVVSAVQKNNSLLGNTWRNILGNWFAANALNNPSGIKGYNGEYEFKVYIPDEKVNLYPGWGVYANTATYNDVNIAGTRIVESGKNFLIVYNISTAEDARPKAVPITVSSMGMGIETLPKTKARSTLNAKEGQGIPRGLWVDAIK